MRFKTFRHCITGEFGGFEMLTPVNDKPVLEAYTSSVPTLFPMTSSYEGMKNYYKNSDCQKVDIAMENFEMIEVELNYI